MSSQRFWTIAIALTVGWLILMMLISSSNTYNDDNLRAACEARAWQIENPGINDMYGKPIRLPLDPDSECARIKYQMAQHNQSAGQSSVGWAFIGSIAILAISGVIFGFRRTRQDVIHEIKTHPRTEIIMGDVIRDIQGSTIINRSTLRDSLNSIEVNQPQLLEAMAELTRIVAKSGNKAAAELFEQVTEEASKPNPRKSVLQSCWTALVAALPLIKDSVAVFKTVSDFVQSV